MKRSLIATIGETHITPLSQSDQNSGPGINEAKFTSGK